MKSRAVGPHPAPPAGRPLNVLHVVTTLSAGGAELHLLSLCKAQQRRGTRPTVAFLREHVHGSRSLRSDFSEAGIRVVDLRGARRLGVRWIPRLVALLKEVEPDIVHTHLPRADAVGAVAKLLRRSGIVWVSSIHGVDPYRRSRAGRFVLRLLRPIWRYADAVIAISGRVRAYAANRLGIPDTRIRVVPYGIDLADFAERAGEPARAGPPVVISVGRLEPSKGHQHLIRAMQRVGETHPSARLWIIGQDPGGFGKELRTLVDRLGLGDTVEILGFRRDVPALLARADVFAFASETEGFGLVLLEAMAARCPVVASRIAPLTEIVEEGSTGLLATPRDPEAFADAIATLLSDPERARRIGEGGWERVSRLFTVDAMVRGTASVYQEAGASQR